MEEAFSSNSDHDEIKEKIFLIVSRQHKFE
jgi:hypothetical protein